MPYQLILAYCDTLIHGNKNCSYEKWPFVPVASVEKFPASRSMVGQMDITFLGTSSAVPSSTRNHQCMALRLATGKVLVFDVGEASQHQFQKSQLKTGRIHAIFITHMHGDHCYGLPPLMCTLSMGNVDSNEPLEIYGPANLRAWLRTTFKFTCAHLNSNYRVHEFLLPGDPIDLNQDLLDTELPGDNIELQPGEHRHWLVQLPDGHTVTTVPILHSIPALGYIVNEPAAPGKIDPAELRPVLESHRDGLAKQGVKNPMTLLGQLQKGHTVKLPDGSELKPAAPRPGRKVVILGDTRDASSIIPFCTDPPHVLVHEATNALTSLDPPGTTLQDVTASTLEHGHSTPQIAGRLAKAVNAKHLLLTHFSSRYRGDDSPEALAVMEEIRQQAIETAGHDHIHCARDLWTFNVEL